MLTQLRDCCMGVIEGDPTDCTCWEPIYDTDRQAPPATSIEPGTRSTMCDDCAYRPDSPERKGDERYQEHMGDAEHPFWCHQGLRKPIAYRHPAGITVETDCDHYQPPIVDDVPYKANGQPADRCAGWAAHHRLNEAT